MTKPPKPAPSKKSPSKSKRGGAQASKSKRGAASVAQNSKRAPVASARAKTAESTGKIIVVDGEEFFDALPSDVAPASLQLPALPGRPTLYRPTFAQIAVRLGANGHTIAGIAGRLGVTRETVYEWARRHPEFSDALQRSKAAAVAFYESRLIHIAQHGGGVGSAAACIFALKARASHEWLPPRAPDISELPDDSSQMRDVTPDPEATEEQISVVQRALALHVAMDEREITDELLHDVAVAPIAADHGPEYAHPGTSVGKALEWLKAKSGGRGNVFSAVDASIEAHRRKNATAPAAAPAAAPAPPAQPIADDALEILPPKSRVGRIIDI